MYSQEQHYLISVNLNATITEKSQINFVFVMLFQYQWWMWLHFACVYQFIYETKCYLRKVMNILRFRKTNIESLWKTINHTDIQLKFKLHVYEILKHGYAPSWIKYCHVAFDMLQNESPGDVESNPSHS